MRRSSKIVKRTLYVDIPVDTRISLTLYLPELRDVVGRKAKIRIVVEVLEDKKHREKTENTSTQLETCRSVNSTISGDELLRIFLEELAKYITLVDVPMSGLLVAESGLWDQISRRLREEYKAELSFTKFRELVLEAARRHMTCNGHVDSVYKLLSLVVLKPVVLPRGPDLLVELRGFRDQVKRAAVEVALGLNRI